MLTIRPAQILALHGAIRPALAEQLVRELEQGPPLPGLGGPDARRAFVRDCLDAAARYDLVGEREVRFFVRLALVLGPRFHHYPPVDRRLSAPGSDREDRLDALIEQVHPATWIALTEALAHPVDEPTGTLPGPADPTTRPVEPRDPDILDFLLRAYPSRATALRLDRAAGGGRRRTPTTARMRVHWKHRLDAALAGRGPSLAALLTQARGDFPAHPMLCQPTSSAFVDPVDASHVEALRHYATTEDLGPELMNDHDVLVEDPWSWLRRVRHQAETDAAACFVTVADGHLVGVGSLLRIDGHPPSCQLSYWIHPAARRRGLGRLTAAIVARYAIARLGAECIETWVTEDNVPSRRILDQLGFRAPPQPPGTGGKKSLHLRYCSGSTPR